MVKSKTNYLTVEEIISLPNYTDVAVSEDGDRVAYVRHTADWDDNVYRQHVWVYDQAAGKSTPITMGKVESMHPLWSPDSRYLAFLSPVRDGEEKTKQIFLISIAGTEIIQVTYGNESVENFKWSPNSRGIFFTAKRPETDKIKKRKERYGDFTYVDQDFRYNALYYLDLTEIETLSTTDQLPKDLRCDRDEVKAEPLTESLLKHIYHYDISPDGKTIVFNAAPTPRMIDYYNLEMFLINTESKEISKLAVSSLHTGSVLFSPDGSKLCYTRYAKEKLPFNNLILEIYDLDTKETAQPVQDIDEHVDPIRWTNKGILVTWQKKTNVHVGLVSENGRLDPLGDLEDMVVTSPSMTLDGHHFACVKASSLEAAEIYFNNKRITAQYRYYEGKTKSQKEVIQWRSSDGLEIEGVLSKPEDYDSSKRYPLILAVHGGPAGTSFATPTTNKYQPIEQFIEKGFLVLEPNYRGSAGYGEAFRKANIRQLGIGDYEDIISGVDHLIEKGLVDQDKVGILGWSQGGYISAFCATYSHRFKAISVGAGISNWMTYYVNTDITQFTRNYLGATPWEDEGIYRKTSPMTYITNALTPTLIQHGEKDERVPVPNAYELYRGLKDVGVETELVIYKGMGHGSNKPGFNRAILKQNLEWFTHHILGIADEDSQPL